VEGGATMTTMHIIQTAAEIIIVAALIAGLIGEQKIVKIEKIIFSSFKKLWEAIR
jgi:hypothetical protein